MPGSYTLELELFTTLGVTADFFEIWADGSQLGGGYSISSSGSTISVSVPYGGALPTSLEFRFNDSLGGVQQIEVRSVKINDRYVNTNNYLSGTTLNEGGSQTVAIGGNDFLFDASEPAPSEFTTGATQTFDGTNNTYRNYNETVDQVFNMLAGRDVALLGSGNDKVAGDAGDDYLYGYGGNDLLYGGADNDRLYGGDGDDRLYGGDGDDIVQGDAGNDEIHGGAGNDRLQGNDGNDIITGGTGADRLLGGAGDDYLFGDDDNDTLSAGTGNDTLDGGAGNDLMYGGAGVDHMNGGDGDDIMVGDTGNDVMHGDDGDDIMYGRNDDDEMYGGIGDDYLHGGNGTDIMDGGAGADILTGGAGADTITGGAGADLIHGHGLDVVAIQTILKANPSVTYNAYTNSFYQLIITNANYITAQNTAITTTLSGLAGHLVNITSATENTYISSLLSSDTWIGGRDLTVGGDYSWQNGAEAGASFSTNSGINLNNFYDSWRASQPDTVLDTVVSTRVDGGWSDRSISDSYDYVVEWDAGLMSDDNAIDILSGGTGDDTIYGYGGNDTLSGGDDHDLIFGGIGNDIINGDDGNDALYGQAGNDTLDGGSGNDTIDGGIGNDTINGSTGNDAIHGGAGADTIDAGADNDTVLLANGDFAVGESITGGAGTDEIILTNATTVDFSTGTLATLETLTGSAGNDDVTYTIQQALDFTTIDLGGGTDNSRVNITGTVDVTALGTPTVSNAENGFLTGSTGNDTLTIIGAQLDALIFGTGTINFAAGTDILNITSTSADLNILGATNASVQGLETISASTAGAGVTINMSGQTEAFTITGSNSADTITGGTGADIIDGGNGNGNDTINLANGHFAAGESLTGGGGTDNITLTNATTVDFTTGTLATIETLNGSTGNDIVTISGTQLNQFTSLDFGTGTDVLNITSTSTGLNALADGSLANVQTVSASTSGASVTIDLSVQTENFIVTGSGNADILTAGSGSDTINGGNGNDIISGEAGADIINGGNNNDVLLGGAGADTLDGGSGDDYLHGNSLTQAQIQAILTANPTVVYNAGTNSFYEFVASGATWTASQPLAAASVLNSVNGHLATITHTAEMDFLDSQVNPTNNTSIGSYWTSGNDLVTTGDWRFTDGIEAGVQFWSGQDAGSTVNGFDDMWVAGQPNSATQNYVYLLSYGDGLADANNAAFAHGDGYIVEWVAGLMNDDNAIDILSGGAGDDHLYGYGGGDTLNGGDGVDLLFGGAGNDTLNGDAGADVLVGGAGDDTIYGDNTTTPTVNSTQGWNFQYYNLPFTATPDLNGAGFTLNGGRDHNLGSTTAGIASNFTPAAYDTGDDYALKFETTLTITTAGNYRFRTNSDDGSMLFLDGVQIVNNDGLHGNVTVTSSNTALAAGTYTLELTFFERGGGNVLNAEFRGPDTGNSWTGLATYAGANVVTHSSAGGSDDIIYGGAGTDTLYGSGGSDTFVFEAASAFAQTDIIMDFSTTDGDILDISDLITGAFSGNIKEYLQFTSDGATGDTLVQVDANGTTGGTSFQTIARLDGIVGLDETTLYNAGDIIV